MIFPFKEMSDEYRIGIKSPIKEDASAGFHLVERSLYDSVDTDGATDNGPDEPVNNPVKF